MFLFCVKEVLLLQNRLASGFQVLKLNQRIRSTSNSNGNKQDFNENFHDNVHLNYSPGVPMLRIFLLSCLLRTSTGLVNAVLKMHDYAVYDIGPTKNSQAPAICIFWNPFKNRSFYKIGVPRRNVHILNHTDYCLCSVGRKMN